MIKQGLVILMAVFFTLFLSVVFSKSPVPFLESSVQKAFDSASLRLGGKDIKVEIADTDEKRTKGLGGRKSVGDDEGMIFVFESPNTYSFWMKDMLFPIDIIWINNDRIVIDIDQNVSPDTYPTAFFPPDHIRYVVETNANWAQENGVAIGDLLEF